MTKRILVVDDEPNVALAYRVALETEGCAVLEANSGKNALERFAEGRFELALLDLRMPEMDGLELLAEMRKRGITTPTVIITAHGDIPNAVRAMKLGSIDFLQKPLTPEQLRQICREVIDRHTDRIDTESEIDSDPDLGAEALRARYVVKAKRLLNLQQFEAARITLAKALALDPLSAESFNLAGSLFELQEDYIRAKQFYSQAVKVDQNYEPAQQNIRRLLERSQFGASKQPLAMGDR